MPISDDTDNSSAPADVLLTIEQFVAQQPAMTKGGTRWAIFNEKYNGLAESGAIVRVGKRVLIDPVQFMDWMRTNPKLSPPRPKAMKQAAAKREIKPAKRAGRQGAPENREVRS